MGDVSVQELIDVTGSEDKVTTVTSYAALGKVTNTLKSRAVVSCSGKHVSIVYPYYVLDVSDLFVIGASLSVWL